MMPTADPGPDFGRLPQLDALRSVAALGVVALHWAYFFPVPQIAAKGYLFVDLFFLLSGFVLTPVVARAHARGLRSNAFLLQRLRRFWPLVAVGTIVGLGAFILLGSDKPVALHAALGLAFVPALMVSQALFPLNTPQWSLLWELLANRVHLRWLDQAGDRALISLVAASGAMFAAIVLWHGDGDVGAHWATWWMALPRVAFSYTLGILFARRFAGTSPAAPLRWIAALMLPAALVLMLPLAGSPLAEAALVLAGFPLTFLWLARARPDPRWDPALRAFGRLSFPLYATHLPIIFLVQLFGNARFHGVFALVAVIAIAALLARVLEPGRRSPRAAALPAAA